MIQTHNDTSEQEQQQQPYMYIHEAPHIKGYDPSRTKDKKRKRQSSRHGQEEPPRASVDWTGSVMVEEEHDDALPDDAEPGHLLPQRPAESASSSPAFLPLATPTPRLVHCWNLLSAASGPTGVNNGDNRVTCTGAIALLI